jgi:serine/threonine-protein kinase
MDRESFIRQLEQGGLLDETRLRLRLEELRGQPQDGRGLARVLMQQGLLTPYQANQLLTGKGKELQVGAYGILERLGQGGMGQVFKAVHRGQGRVVAIKVLSRQLVNNPQAAARFQREIEATSQLQHPNIVMACEAFDAEGSKCLVMEFVEGVDLGRLVRETGPMPIDLACHCLHQAALGLQHAHERGLVHRDLKPSNLLLQATRAPTSAVGRQKLIYGNVKILDLGLARFCKAARANRHPSATLTQIDQVMGTPDFMSPEQARDTHKADHLSDLYSLGTTFYFCLAGQPPFPEGDPLEKILKHQFDQPPPVENFRPEMSPSLAKLIRRMMAKDRKQRPQSAAEVAKALEQWQQAPEVIASLPALPEPEVPQPKTPRVVKPSKDKTPSLHFVPVAAAGSPALKRSVVRWIWWGSLVGSLLMLVALWLLFGNDP